MPRKQLFACLRNSTDSVASNSINRTFSPDRRIVSDFQQSNASGQKSENSRSLERTCPTETQLKGNLICRMRYLTLSEESTKAKREIATRRVDYDPDFPQFKHVQEWIQSTGSTQSMKCMPADGAIKTTEVDCVGSIRSDREIVPIESSSIVYNDQLYGMYQLPYNRKGSWTSNLSERSRSQSGRTVCVRVADQTMSQNQLLFLKQPNEKVVHSSENYPQQNGSTPVANATSSTYKSTLTVYISGTRPTASWTGKTRQCSQQDSGTNADHEEHQHTNLKVWAHNEHQGFDETQSKSMKPPVVESYILPFGNRSTDNRSRRLHETTQWDSDSQALGTSVETEAYEDDHFTSVSELGASKRLGSNLRLLEFDSHPGSPKLPWSGREGNTDYSPERELPYHSDERTETGVKMNLTRYRPQTYNAKAEKCIEQERFKISPLTTKNLALHNLNYEFE